MQNPDSGEMMTQFWPWLWPALLFSELLFLMSFSSSLSLFAALAGSSTACLRPGSESRPFWHSRSSSSPGAGCAGLVLPELGQSWALNAGIP